jgi:PAS domain S-box-containing protein
VRSRSTILKIKGSKFRKHRRNPQTAGRSPRPAQILPLDAPQRLKSILIANEVATWTWDIVQNRVIADANLARLFDISPEDASGGPIESYIEAIHFDDRARVSNTIEAVLQGPNDKYETEYRIVRKDGTIAWVIARGKVERDANGRPKYFPGVLIDITKRKKSEKEAEALQFRLAQQSQILDIALSSISDFAYIFDRAGRFCFVNQALLDLWGLKLDQAVGKNFYDLKYPDELAAKLQRQVESVFETKSGLVDETPYTSPTGAGGYYEYIFRPVLGRDGNVEFVAGSTRDITSRKRLEEMLRESEKRLRLLAETLDSQVCQRTAELEDRNKEVLDQSEQLRELSVRLIEAKDQEGRRLARELHDSVGQMLAALSMNQSLIGREKEQLSKRSQIALAENVEMTEQILKEVRTISHLLHPPLLDEVGLPSALRCYLEGFNRRSNMEILLEMPDDFGRLPLESEIAAFRIIQECLTNAYRHSKSERAVVTLTRNPGAVCIRVVDDGVGIPKSKIQEIKSGKTSGVGLRGMRERIRQFDGALEIISGEKGTVIEISIPIVIP